MTTPRVTVPVDDWKHVVGALKNAQARLGPGAAVCNVSAALAKVEHLSAALAPEGGVVKGPGDYTMCIAEPQTFERFPALASHIERMAVGRSVGSLIEWDAFLRELNAALATREEAPAEAGEDAIKAACVAWHQAKGENPFNVLYHGAWCGSFPHQTGPERWTFTVPAMKQAVEAYLRAQPQAREEAQPMADAVEPIEQAITTLKGHIAAIQAGKQDGGSSTLITDCINGLPEIVRWIESGLFNVDAAFEQYEDTPPAPEAEKLREKGAELIKALNRFGFPVSGAASVNLGAFGSSEALAVDFTTREFIKALSAAPGEAGE